MTIPKIYNDIIEHSTHILLAGATGSGKSVTLHGLITSLLCQKNRPYLAFIDLKRVEMADYKRLYNLYGYADDAEQALLLLDDIRREIERRYKYMMKHGQKKWTGKAIYLIIDEYAELLINSDRKCVKPLQSIAQLGRAASVHIILASQVVLARILTTEVKLNFDTQLALRTRSAQDSRNIINIAGAETLPRYGYGILVTPDLLKPAKVQLPMVEEKTRCQIIRQLSI